MMTGIIIFKALKQPHPEKAESGRNIMFLLKEAVYIAMAVLRVLENTGAAMARQ